VVWVGGIIATLYLAQACCELWFVQLKLLHQACRLQQMEGQHGQTVPRGSLSICKDVKLPVALCILHRPKLKSRLGTCEDVKLPVALCILHRPKLKSRLGTCEDVKLPVALCILHRPRSSQDWSHAKRLCEWTDEWDRRMSKGLMCMNRQMSNNECR